MKTSNRFKQSFLRRFPVPHYVAIPAVGIDISDRSIKFIAFSPAHGGIDVDVYGTQKLQDGVVVDGIIKDRQKLSAALATLKETYSLGRYIRASLPEEKAFLFTLPVPTSVLESELPDLIRFKLEEYVPLRNDEVVFDYDFVNEKKKEGSTEQTIVVSAFPRDLAEAYTDIFLDAGLTPLSLEIEAQAVARSVVPHHAHGTALIVDFGRTRSGLAVVRGHAVVFTTTIGIGGDALSDTVKELYPDADQEEIDRIKREKGCLLNETNKELCASLISVVAALRDEINRHLIYWQTHEKEKNQKGIEHIILCGGNANLAGITRYLEGSLGLPVSHADVWTNTGLLGKGSVPPISKYHSLGYAPAIGLALHGM